jgi:uncharacterized protein YdeI (YjbR/CyaY-like superfamily)
MRSAGRIGDDPSMARAVPHDEREQVHIETIADWRRWLEANHARSAGVWLVSWKASTGRPRPTYEESVEEALAFGWIDSKGRTLDDERSMQWFSPRKAGSGWARTNKERIVRLERDGRMTAAGRAIIDQAKADGTWTLLDAVEDLIVPDDLAAAFAANPGARAHWDEFPRSARRALLEWLVQAKRPETRARRIAEVASRAARGERANQP